MCYIYLFCLHCCLINIHVFDYPDSWLSELFTEVPTSPDNRGSTVVLKVIIFIVTWNLLLRQWWLLWWSWHFSTTWLWPGLYLISWMWETEKRNKKNPQEKFRYRTFFRLIKISPQLEFKQLTYSCIEVLCLVNQKLQSLSSLSNGVCWWNVMLFF